MTVGDMHWAQLPTANGHEQGGRRLAIILQHDQYAGELPVVLVVPLTTARAAMRFSGTTLIRPTAENGVPQPSVALVFQLRGHRSPPRAGAERPCGYGGVAGDVYGARQADRPG